MRKDWEVKKLGEICLSIKDGSHNPPKGIESGSYLMLSSQNIQDGYIDFKNSRFISEDDFRKEQKRVKVKKGDLLLTIVGTIGRSCVFDGSIDNIVFQRSVAVLTPKVDIVPFFLRYFIKSKKTLLENEAKGVAQKGIYLKQLSDFKISVPPLQIQQQIVEELDCLTSIIEKQKKQLEELDNLAQSIFYDMFGDPIENEKGWNPSTIDNVCSSIIRGPFGSALKKDYFVEKDDSTYKVYEQKNAINKNAFIGTYYIPKEMYDSLSRFEVFPNDIIMSCSGTIGELFVIPYEAERGIINQALLKFTLNNKIEQYYFLFMMGLMKSKLDVKGCGIQNIGSVKYIKATSFGLPPLSLQQQFAAKIEAIEKQKELIKISIKETEDLFNSRMDYYFN